MRFVLVLALFVVLLTACAQQPTGNLVNDEPILFGFIGPLSGDGVAYGETEKNTVIMAVEQINNNGGINGRRVKVIFEDGKCSGRESTLAAQKLIEVDKVKFILGGICSTETLAALPITDENKVMLFSAFSSSPELTGRSKYFFRTVWSDDEVSPAIVDMIASYGHKRVALLTENTDYAAALRSGVIESATDLEIVADETFDTANKDFRAQITKIKSSKPDAIFVNVQSDVTGGLAVKQLREQGVTVPFYGYVVFSGPNFVQIAGDATEGAVFLDAPGLSSDSGKALLAEYKKRFGDPSNDFQIGTRYDSVMLLADAIKICNEDTDCVSDYLTSVEYDGVIGKIHFENSDVRGIGFTKKMIVDGKVTE